MKSFFKQEIKTNDFLIDFKELIEKTPNCTGVSFVEVLPLSNSELMLNNVPEDVYRFNKPFVLKSENAPIVSGYLKFINTNNQKLKVAVKYLLLVE